MGVRWAARRHRPDAVTESALAAAAASGSSAGQHGVRGAVPGPAGPGGRVRQGRSRAAHLGGARLRLRRGRHRDRAGATRQPATAAVPAARRPGAAQPDGFQQSRCPRAGGPTHRSCSRRARRGEHRQDQGDTAGPGGRRLRRECPVARTAGVLPGGQRQFAEHAGSAGSAVGAVAASHPGCSTGPDLDTGAGEDRPGSGRRRHRPDRRSGRRTRAGGDRGHQHHDFLRRSGHPRRGRPGARRNLRPTGGAPRGRGAAAPLPARR